MIDNNRIFDTQLDTQKIFVSVKTSFKLRKDVVTKNGTSPIYLHITGNSIRRMVNLELHVLPKNWIEKTESVRPVDRQHQDLNLVLDHIKTKISDVRINYRLSNKHLTPDILKEELVESTPRIHFVAYMRSKIKEDKSLRPTTARRYTSVANNLDAYKKDVTFAEITETFINKYRNHMLGKGNKSTTVNGNIKAIKQYLKMAKKKDKIVLQVDLDDISGGSTTGNRTALTPAEVRTLCRYYFDKKLNGTKQLTLGYFLFSCMTGLRVSAVLDLDRHHLLSLDFAFINMKSSKDQTIALNKMARKIIENNPDLFIKKLHPNTMNEDLKRIAKNNRISKHLTFHVSRHTFATNFLRMGGKVENLQKLMAHSKIETTMIYVHILAAEANAEIHKLDDLFKDFGFDLEIED